MRIGIGAYWWCIEHESSADRVESIGAVPERCHAVWGYLPFVYTDEATIEACRMIQVDLSRDPTAEEVDR